MSEINNINQKMFDEFFRKYRKKALVYLRSSKEAFEDFDPFRETGYKITNQNPLPVKVITKVVSPNSLILKELGMTEAGAIWIILNQRDVTLIQNSEKITIDNKEYYVYNDAVGSKFQIFDTDYTDFSKIILFRKQVTGDG